MFFNTFVIQSIIMRKNLLLVFAFIFIMSVPSCYLFKPVQKTCPAYSSVIPTGNTHDVLTCEVVVIANEEQL